MLNLKDIHPLTSFLRDHKTHIEHLAKTGRPEVLTVNGKAAVVVQDVESYQRLVELADMAESAMIVKRRVEEVQRGAKSVPAEDVLAEMRKQLGIKKKRSA